MNEKETIKELDELIEYMSVNKIRHRRPVLKADKKDVDSSFSDCLNTLKVCVKYLVFDLEATRRENSHLKKLFNK